MKGSTQTITYILNIAACFYLPSIYFNSTLVHLDFIVKYLHQQIKCLCKNS